MIVRTLLLLIAAGAALGAEVLRDPAAPQEMPKSPLTAVVVTQCNLIVAVYMTTKDGKLYHYDKSSNVPWQVLLDVAYSANRSERVEVSCNGEGLVGTEPHSRNDI